MMMKPRGDQITLAITFTVVISAWVPPVIGSAQDAGADAGTVADAGAVPDAGTVADAGALADAAVDEVPPKAASDAERIIRIRRVIELDTQRLRALRLELKSRTKWFEDLAEALTETTNELNVKKEALAAAEEEDSEEADALRAQVAELEQDYELLDVQTDLALKGEKKTAEQIDALRDKIAKEERALGELTGEIPIEDREAPPEEPEPTDKAPKAEKAPMPIPTPVPIPTAPPERPDTKGPSALTAAQLAAHKVVDQKEHEARLAQVAVEEFIERKRALEEQIEFEEGLSETELKELENLKRAGEVFKARLEAANEAGGPPEKIKRLERTIRNVDRYVEEASKANASRVEYIESLHERQELLDEEELRVTAVADEKEKEAEKARRQIVWLESPIHPLNVLHWAKDRGPRMLLVIAAIALLLLFVRFSARGIARTFVHRRRSARDVGTRRADTLAFSFRSVSQVIIVILGILLVLQEAGINITTVLGGAAILGVAIAFGAQDLMKDYFSGFLILMEDQYQLGDLITIGNITGTVESVNMRVTVLRDLEGRVHFIPNGEIDSVTNRTYGWGRPVFEIPVSYDENVDRVMATLVDEAKKLGQDPDWKDSVIGEPDMLGVDKFSEYGVIVKFMVKTQPDQLFAVRRELLRRIKNRFDKEGIRITVPHRLIVQSKTDTEE